MAAAVHQHERSLRAEAAQVEQVEAGDADCRCWVLLLARAAQLGQLVELVADVGVALLDERFPGDRGDRHGRFEIGREMREPVTMMAVSSPSSSRRRRSRGPPARRRAGRREWQ
jgi:hypothetical protein